MLSRGAADRFPWVSSRDRCAPVGGPFLSTRPHRPLNPDQVVLSQSSSRAAAELAVALAAPAAAVLQPPTEALQAQLRPASKPSMKSIPG